MLRSYLEAIILDSLMRIKGERTVYSVFHVLAGKKSSQTIQDIHLYEIAKYFRTYPTMKREDFQHIIAYFEEQGLIEVNHEKGEYRLAPKSRCVLDDFYRKNPVLTYLNGFKHHNTSMLFWKRFSLLFQVLSNVVHRNGTYYCIQRDLAIQNWVKDFLFHHKSIKNMPALLHHELQELLSTVSDQHAVVFLLKLSGYQRIGYSHKQIADQLRMNESDVYYTFLHVLHRMLQQVEERPTSLLGLLGDDLRIGASSQTNSSMVTYKYLKYNLTIDQIAEKRHLKRNTIEDHIIELVINRVINDISAYVSDELAGRIICIATEGNTRQLKAIKQALLNRVSYFQIRLALAKGGSLD